MILKAKSYTFSLTVGSKNLNQKKIVDDYRIEGYTLIGYSVNYTCSYVMVTSATFQTYNNVQGFILIYNDDSSAYTITGGVNLYYVKNDIIE